MPAQPSEPPGRNRPAVPPVRAPEHARDAGMARTRIITRWIAAGSVAGVGVFGALAAVSTHKASSEPAPAVVDDPVTEPAATVPAPSEAPATTVAPATAAPAPTAGTRAPATTPSSAPAATTPRTTPTTITPAAQAPVRVPTRHRPAATSGGS
jgi:hypothetical protein